MSKSDNKADFEIDEVDYKQIERKKGEKTSDWKLQPKSKEGYTSGLHFISGTPERNHLDYYQDGEKIGKSGTEIRMGGLVIRGKETFAIPSNHIIELSKEKIIKLKSDEYMKKKKKGYIRI